jgi:hypothetical protein
LLAVAGALARLRSLGRAVRVDPSLLARAISRCEDRTELEALVGALGEAGARWEPELVRGVLEARTDDEARAAANEVLLDVGASLSWATSAPAVGVRVALLGTVLAVALLIARDASVSLELLDVVALGGGGAMVALSAAAQARRLARELRKAVDELADRTLERAAALRAAASRSRSS